MAKTAAKPTRPSTRDRILQAAVARFASATYDEVSLRDLAADVGVDVAYVHRSFGSKASLFEAALQAASGDDGRPPLADAPPDECAFDLVRRLLDKPRFDQRGGPGPMDILLRSLASKKASAILRDKAERDILRPIAERMGHEGDLRAAIVVALLLGMGMARDLIQLDALTDPEREPRMRRLLEAAITALSEVDLHEAS